MIGARQFPGRKLLVKHAARWAVREDFSVNQIHDSDYPAYVILTRSYAAKQTVPGGDLLLRANVACTKLRIDSGNGAAAHNYESW
jgi:hypothetical protein